MKKASVTTSKLNTYKKNYKRYIQQRQQQQQNANANANTNTKYRLVRRSNSQDNLNERRDIRRDVIVMNRDKYITEDMLDDVRTRLTSLIEFKTKYYVDQRMLTLMQSDDILARGSDAIRIASDWSTGGKAFIFSNNGEAVAKITDSGVLYCKNIWMNGVNMMQLVNNVLNSLSDGASIYVKHIDLKSGTYDMDINEAIMKHLLVKADDDNNLEFLYNNYTALTMNTDREVGYAVFNPNMANGNTVYPLRFGKNGNTGNGGQLRYTHNGNNNSSNYMALGVIGSADTLRVYQNRAVYIRTSTSMNRNLEVKYEGNLSNNNALRFAIGDNRDAAMLGMYRANNVNYAYMKLIGRSASVAVYANYTSLDANDYILCNVTKKNADVLQLLTSQTLTNGDYIRYLFSDNGGGKANIDLMHDTQYYGLRLKIDTADNTNDNKLCIWPTGVTIDGKLDAYNDVAIWENLEVGKDITMQDSYKLYTNYIQPIPDTGNSIYMTGRVYVNDGALSILDNNITTGNWGNLLTIGKWYNTNNIALAYYYDENTPRNCGWKMTHTNGGLLLNGDGYTTAVHTATFNHLANASNVTHKIGKDDTNCLTIAHTIDYSTNPVTFKLTRYNQAETNMLKLYGTTVEVPNGISLKLDNTSISSVAKASDTDDDTKVNDHTIPTTEYVKKLNSATHQQIPNNPYESIAITDNPYLKWSVNSVGNYDTNTDAVCYSEELHQFVIVGNGYTYFSYDGFTWMSNSMNAYTWTGVTYGPTYGYITCTSSNMFLLSSTDGRTWVPHNNVAPSTGRAITYGNGYYAIVPDGTYASYLDYTDNPTIATGWGSYWLGSTGKWYNIAYSKSQHKFMVVGASGKYVSFDDEFTSDSRVTGQLSGVTYDCSGVCYSDKLNLWVIAVNDSSYCYISSDGNTFTQVSLPYQTSWHRVIWGADRFIMTSSGSSSAAYSLDGTNWYPFDISTIGAYSSWLGLAYGNGVFVLSGDNNTAPLNALVATYTSPNSYITPRAMMQAIYPIGSIYMSMVNINPGVIFGGSWTEIQNRFLYCVPTTLSSNNTGGSDRHNHPLSDDGYACIATHGAGNIVVRERSTPAWPSNYRMSTGTYGTAPDTDSWGQCLRGFTDNASSLPPYITVYAWYRYA